MAINIITGLPGSGKTYVLAKMAKQFLEEGTQVYSNFRLLWPGENLHYWRSWDDLKDIRFGIIICDELPVYFNSRQWEKLDPETMRLLQQHRKKSLHIWGTVQHEARIDVSMRELVSEFYQCRKIAGSSDDAEKPWGLIRMDSYWPEDMKNPNKTPDSTEWFFIKKEICDFYDTLAEIELPPPKDEITIRMKICPHCQSRKTKS